MDRIYFDNNATTPIDHQVATVVYKSMLEVYGNPSSTHLEGQLARKKISEARRAIAGYLNVPHRDVVFTSGGTEAVNMILRSLAVSNPRGHIITSFSEHACVYNTVLDLQNDGMDVTFLAPGPKGAISLEAIAEAIKPTTSIIALMAVNNETGVKTDLEGIATLAEERNIDFVVDGVAWLGKEPLKIYSGIKALTFSAHKIHGPKGVGGAYIDKSLKISPFITGGGQEEGRRSGTENLHGIIGMAEAFKLLIGKDESFCNHITNLRKRFEKGLKEVFPDIIVHGTGERISNTVNVAFPGIEAETLLMKLDLAGVAVGYGSACSSGALEPSRALLYMDVSAKLARSSIRFSFSRMNTVEEVDMALDKVVSAVLSLKI